MEGILRTFLRSHLSSYLSSEEDEGSGLSFKGVEFRTEEYPRVKRFTAQALEILVPWAALATQSIEVHLRGVDLALGQDDTETHVDGRPVATQGKPWDEGELANEGYSSWADAEQEADREGMERQTGAPTIAQAAATSASSWVGMSIRSRLIRSGLNVSLYVEDFEFTEDLGTHVAKVCVGSLSVVNIPLDDWAGLVREPAGWLGKAVVLEDLTVSIGDGSRVHIGSVHISSVLPLYEFLEDSFEYRESDRVVPVSVSASTLVVEGEMGLLIGWMKDKITGEANEDAWSADVGVSVGELSYGAVTLSRVVVLWRDGETVVRTERVGVELGVAAVGELICEDMELQMEGGTAWIDRLVLHGNGVEVRVSGVEWGSKLRVGSVVCEAKVAEILEKLLVELREQDETQETRQTREGQELIEGSETTTSQGGGPSVEVGTVVVGFETEQGAMTVWSSGLEYGSGRLVLGCMGIDSDSDRMVHVQGEVVMVWKGRGRTLYFGEVEIWLLAGYLAVAKRCWELYGLVFGDNSVNRDDSERVSETLDIFNKVDAIANEQDPSEVRGFMVEFESFTVRLGERDGAKEVTLVDTRTGARVLLGVEEVLSVVGELEDGYSLFEDREEEDLWWISRPVSLQCLLKQASVDSTLLCRGEMVQLQVPTKGGRLCELDVQGSKIVLGVPPWSDEGEEDWGHEGYDVLVPAPGSVPTELRFGDGGECLLVSKLTTYNRLDITLTPRLMVRNELDVPIGVCVMGEKGRVEVEEGSDVGLSVAGGRSPLLRFDLADGKKRYQTVPVVVDAPGSTVVELDEGAAYPKLAIVVEHPGWTTVSVRDAQKAENDAGVSVSSPTAVLHARALRICSDSGRRSTSWEEVVLLQGGRSRKRHEPKLRISRSDVAIVGSAARLCGLNRIDFGRFDNDSVQFFLQLYEYWQNGTAATSTEGGRAEGGDSDTSTNVSLMNPVEIAGDIALDAINLPNALVNIKAIEDANFTTLIAHIRSSALRSVPTLAINWVMAMFT